jgi:hypothetical protein
MTGLPQAKVPTIAHNGAGVSPSELSLRTFQRRAKDTPAFGRSPDLRCQLRSMEVQMTDCLRLTFGAGGATGEEAALRPSPGLQSTATLSAGIRVLVFNGKSVGGSLKVMGYIEGGRGHVSAGDVTSKGLVVGVAFHGR